MLGELVGNYRITAQIGEGGMGAVYEAEHTLIGRKAAVKVLLPQLSDKREVVKRFFREAKATTRIQHPGIVEVFDFGFHQDGHAYLVMELLAGESLSTRRKRKGRLPAAEAIAIVRGIASALKAAHAEGIVHRDLKPDNIWLVRDPDMPTGERTKILDFGIAKLMGEADRASYRTKQGTIMGTPYYMAPEQCRGAEHVDHRADLYALGCILFELLCGRTPFVGTSTGEIIGAHQHVQPPSPRSLEPSIPEKLEAIVMGLLAKRPEDRIPSMRAVCQALDRLTGRAPTAPLEWQEDEEDTDVDPVPRAAPDSATLAEATPPASTTLRSAAAQQSAHQVSQPRRLGRLLAVALAFAVVGAGAGIAHRLAAREDGPSSAQTSASDREAVSPAPHAAQAPPPVLSEERAPHAQEHGSDANVALASASEVRTVAPATPKEPRGRTGTQLPPERDNTALASDSAAGPREESARATRARPEADAPGPRTPDATAPPWKTDVVVESKPPALLYRGGEKIGGTPFIVEVVAGTTTTLLAKKPGYKTATLVLDGKKPYVSVELERNESEELEKNEQAAPPRKIDVVVESKPPALLYRGGEKIGETPLIVEVVAGTTTTLLAKKRGYKTATLILDGKKPYVSVELERNKEAAPAQPRELRE